MPTTTDRPSRIAWLVPLGALLWIAFVVAGFLVVPSVLHRSLSAAELNRLPVEQRIPRQQDQWKLQDDVRSALVQGSVGLLALVGASVGVYVGWRQLQLTREGQVTDRFLRAVDQLGSDKVEVRFGGIYALERIARDSPSDRSAITEVLSAYVRRHLPGSEAHEGYLYFHCRFANRMLKRRSQCSVARHSAMSASSLTRDVSIFHARTFVAPTYVRQNCTAPTSPLRA